MPAASPRAHPRRSPRSGPPARAAASSRPTSSTKGRRDGPSDGGEADGATALSPHGQAAECLKTLAHPHRLRIVAMLLDGRCTVGELAEACGIPSSVTSGHLRLLQRCGMLAPQREGRSVYYRVTEPCLGKFMTCLRERFGI